MNWQERIVIDPDILVGKPVVKGTRLAVEFIIDLLASEWTEDEILHNYPGLTHDDIVACLRYASAQPLRGIGAQAKYQPLTSLHAQIYLLDGRILRSV